MTKLLFTRSALNDLERLRGFIAEKNPTAASNVAKRLLASIHKLQEHPKMGKAVAGIQNVRDWVVGDYVTRYQIKQDCIVILRVWHDKEDR